jgi:hypothetical protein
MSEAKHYKPTKLVLYQVCPKIIRSFRIPGSSDDSPGRRSGDPSPDEVAGANDIVYHLMCTDTIAVMAKHLGISRERMFNALDIGLHDIYRQFPDKGAAHER